MQAPINISIIYAREDKEIKQRLLLHLNPFKNLFNAVIWHDEHIEPGQEWKPHIDSRLEQTDLFLLLISIDFMNSEFINQVEFKHAIDRHKGKKSIAIPVIINYCQWDIDINFKEYTFNLNELQVLPQDAKPIGDWKTPEQAYNNIAIGVRTVLTAMRKKRNEEDHNQEIEKSRNEFEVKIKLEKESDKIENTGVRIVQEQAQEEKEKITDPFVDEDIRAKRNGRRKNIILSLILFAVILLSYFIFRNTSTSNFTATKTDTLTTKDQGTHIPSMEGVKDENPTNTKGLAIEGLSGTWTGGLWHIRSVVDRTDTAKMTLFIKQTDIGYIGKWEGPINPSGISELSNFTFDGVNFYFIESVGFCVSGKIQDDTMTGEIACGSYNKPFARIRLTRN